MDLNPQGLKASALPEQKTDESLTTVQINPPTLMTSTSPYLPVDDSQSDLYGANCSIDMNASSKSDEIEPVISKRPIADNDSIGAWIKSAKDKLEILPIERSISLPSTIVEQMNANTTTDDLLNPTASTLYDWQKQRSGFPDTLPSNLFQNLPNSTEIQRNLSYPLAKEEKQNIDHQNIQMTGDDNNDDSLPQFLPASQLVDPEIDINVKKTPVTVGHIAIRNKKTINDGSSHPLMESSQSIGNSGEFKAYNPHKAPIRISATATQARLKYNNLQSISDPNKSEQFPGNTLLATLTTNPLVSDRILDCSRTPQLSSIQSSGSPFSPDRLTSVISDASGQSGIESTYLRTSISEPPPSASIIEDDMNDINHPYKVTLNPVVSYSTTSTESLVSSSSEDEYTSQEKATELNSMENLAQRPDSQRLEVIQLLTKLVEKKPMINLRSNLQKRKQHGNVQKSLSSRLTPSVNMPTNPKMSLINSSKTCSKRFPSLNEPISQMRPFSTTSLINSSHEYLQTLSPPIDTLNQSCTSICSMHSDSSLNALVVNTKSVNQKILPGTVSLTSSLCVPGNVLNNHERKRIRSHRHNLSGYAAVSRDRKNSFNKLNSNRNDDQINPSHTIPHSSMPLVRDTKLIINEHLAMIVNLINNYAFNASIQSSSHASSIRDFLYTRLSELSSENPMKQRCSKTETKAFIDSITSYNINRCHHYTFLNGYLRDLLKFQNSPLSFSTGSNETEDEMPSTKSFQGTNDFKLFQKHPLRFFRTLSQDYIRDCEQTEQDLTQKLFDIADKQHIFYCLKHVDSGHENDILHVFHRKIEAMLVWYNLYYELTISVKKLSGLLRCDDCDDWPKLRFRSLATERERKAKRADESDDYVTSEESETESIDDKDNNDSEEVIDIDNDTKTTNNSNSKTKDNDQSDIIPKTFWSDELEEFSNLKISDDAHATQKFDRTSCYQNFVYYMDKRSYQVKYDGLARTLIERIAPVLIKTRFALLPAHDRRQIKIEEIFAGICESDIAATNLGEINSKANGNIDDIDDKLVDTDNPIQDNITNSNIGELTIEKWLHHVLKSCPTMKTIYSHKDEILKSNWVELHEKLGLPSLLPLYFFIINVLLDVINEYLTLYNRPYMNNETIEIDALCRQQLVREAKLVLRDALATRLYTVRMMENFISDRKIIFELTDFDSKTVDLYNHYKQYLSTVSVNRMDGINDSNSQACSDRKNIEYYYYVDEETSELIKEYYFARDLTLTLNRRDLIHALGIQFNDLVRGILGQLRDELIETGETYYQVYAADTSNTPNINDVYYLPGFLPETAKASYSSTSTNLPSDTISADSASNHPNTSFSEQKKSEIIDSTREFRLNFDTIKQRTIRICSLIKTLIDDFSIAAEFQCYSYTELWNQLSCNDYFQVKPYNSDDFDNFYVFVPRWLSNDKNQVEKLVNIICSQQTTIDESRKSPKTSEPSFMVFIPKKIPQLHNYQWKGNTILIRASESTQLALNSTELASLHLVVIRSDNWEDAARIFKNTMGSNVNVQITKRLPRDDDIRYTYDQLPESIDDLSAQLTRLVSTLNTIWDQYSIKTFFTEIIKFDEKQLRTIESKLLDLVLYVYNSGFELFRLLYQLLPTISIKEDKIMKSFVFTMNQFFCEWCKFVTNKLNYIAAQQCRPTKFKVLRPRWFSPGMNFLRFLAEPHHLQLLNDDEHKKLIAAIQALRENTLDDRKAPTIIERSESLSSVSSISGLQRKRSSLGIHHRGSSSTVVNESFSTSHMTRIELIRQRIESRDNELEQKLRERKQIGKIYQVCNNNNNTTTSNTTLDPTTSLKTRNIDFQWRRGTRIGQGGAGIAFRAINCSNGAIVCMKEIQLSSIASRSLPSTYPEKLRLIEKEINMIMSINHPNIVRYFGIETYKRTVYICMEYCLSTVNEFLNDIRTFQNRTYAINTKKNSSKDLSDYDDEHHGKHGNLASSRDVNELVRGFVQQLLKALLALHQNNIVHCDVKGDNIFIANENQNYIVKLGDFNLSHRLNLEAPSKNDSESRSTQYGTLHFKPPEPEYVFKSDIWALGCTIIEMLTGKLPWSNVTRKHDEQIYIQNQLLAKRGPPIPDELKSQPEAYNFIQLCLSPDINDRPAARTLLDHPYPRVRTDT